MKHKRIILSGKAARFLTIAMRQDQSITIDFDPSVAVEHIEIETRMPGEPEPAKSKDANDRYVDAYYGNVTQFQPNPRKKDE